MSRRMSLEDYVAGGRILDGFGRIRMDWDRCGGIWSDIGWHLGYIHGTSGTARTDNLAS
jgi:hypothetical protein